MVYRNTVVLQAPSRNRTKLWKIGQGCTVHLWLCFWGTWAQWKAAELERPHDAMMEKLKTPSYPEKIQILALIPEKWSREYTSKLFDVSEYLIQTACELKKAGGILAKPASRKGKALPQEDDEYSRRWWIQSKEGLCEYWLKCAQTKPIGSVQSIRTVQCIQRQISQHKNWIFQVLYSKTKMVCPLLDHQALILFAHVALSRMQYCWLTRLTGSIYTKT